MKETFLTVTVDDDVIIRIDDNIIAANSTYSKELEKHVEGSIHLFQITDPGTIMLFSKSNMYDPSSNVWNGVNKLKEHYY